jgi:hypothetical protein
MKELEVFRKIAANPFGYAGEIKKSGKKFADKIKCSIFVSLSQ